MVVESEFILIKEGAKHHAQLRSAEFGLLILLLDRVEEFSDILIFCFESEIHIANKEPKLTIFEKSLFRSFLQSIVMNVVDVLNPFSRFALTRCQVAADYRYRC